MESGSDDQLSLAQDVDQMAQHPGADAIKLFFDVADARRPMVKTFLQL
jgi:hypothetical protein